MPRNVIRLNPAFPCAEILPAERYRVQRFARALRRVGATQRPPTRRPGRTRAILTLTVASSDSVNRRRVHRRTAPLRRQLAAAANRRRLTETAESTGAGSAPGG